MINSYYINVSVTVSETYYIPLYTVRVFNLMGAQYTISALAFCLLLIKIFQSEIISYCGNQICILKKRATLNCLTFSCLSFGFAFKDAVKSFVVNAIYCQNRWRSLKCVWQRKFNKMHTHNNTNIHTKNCKY